MKRKYTVFALALAVSILIGMQIVMVADANPYWIWKTIDPIPGAIPPTITVFNPKNYTTYSQNELTVNFVVNLPLLNKSDIKGRGVISDITYSIDNEPVIQSSTNVSSSSANPEYETNVTLPFLTQGNHILMIRANGLVLISSPEMEKFYISSSSIIFFTTQLPEQNHTPTPSVPEFSWLMILPLFIFVFSIAVLIRKRKVSEIIIL
jgi:hypothetical protein